MPLNSQSYRGKGGTRWVRHIRSLLQVVPRFEERNVKSYEQRQKEEQVKPRTTIFGCVYVAIVVAISFFLAGFVMEQIDLYDELGIADMEIPLINYPGKDIPEWTLLAALTVVIFFVLQPLIVIVMGVFSRRDSGDSSSQPPANPWET